MQREFKISLSQEFYSDIVYLSQYDSDYPVIFTVTDKYSKASGINGYTAKFTGTRGDGTGLGFTYTATAIGHTVSFTIDTMLTGVAGTHTGEIIFYDQNDLYFGTANVQIIVEPAARPDGTIDADEEELRDLAQQCQDIVDTAAAEVKGEAESWAVGERDGEPVPSTDPTYQNNAKYYAEQAQDIADSIGIDATLSVSGKAADAKKTGDEISSLKEDLNDVKELVADVDTHQETATETTTPTWEQGYTAPDGSVGSSTTLYYCTPINVSEGDLIQPTRGDGGLIASVYYLTAYYNNSAVSALGSNNVSMPYTVPSGVDKIVLTISSVYLNYGTPKIKRTYTHNVETLDPKYVDKSGVGQVEAKNIKGMTEIGTGISPNLFPKATLLESGKYVGEINASTGKAVLYANASYDTYILPVDGESVYSFTHVRYGCVVADIALTAVGNLLSNTTQINSTGGKYILFSFAPNVYPPSDYIITNEVIYYEVPNNWVVYGTPKVPKDSTSGAIASDGSLEIAGRSALKDGEVITFKGFFEAFNGFTLNFYGTGVTNYITVTADTISIKSASTVPTEIDHGLTIENYVSLVCEFVSGRLKVTLYSRDSTYTTTVNWFQLNSQVTQPQVVSDGTVFSDATLSIAYDAVKRDVWYFGDSYIVVIDPARWPYYLKEDGFLQNILLSGASGGSSSSTVIALNTLLKYGTPKMAVFATGMNDNAGSGGDTSTDPAPAWVSARDIFLKLCNGNRITPVFGTIPTVPSINNRKKNEWIRGSGYRYIDFAKAVENPDYNPETDEPVDMWFPGMLYSDLVHPTGKGARALYTQVLVDLPEIAVS